MLFIKQMSPNVASSKQIQPGETRPNLMNDNGEAMNAGLVMKKESQHGGERLVPSKSTKKNTDDDHKQGSGHGLKEPPRTYIISLPRA